MPFSAYLIFSLVGGLILTVLLKLLFNKITGKNGVDFAHMGEFFGMFITCSIIVLIIMIVITIENA